MIARLAEFLAEVKESGLAGGTVNSYRSSMCGIFGSILGRPKLAEHPLLAGVVTSAKLAIPCKPRYEEIWDASLVVSHWSRTKALSLSEKRARAVSLGILALFARPSDLERISRLPAHFAMTAKGWRFRIRGAKEGKSVSKLTNWIELPFLPDDALDDDAPGCCSCAASAWQSYFDALKAGETRHLPLSAQPYPYGRFLVLAPKAFIGVEGKFHTPLSAERISHIMKDVMSAAGVDTSVFKGGSGRHAGSSAAFASGSHMLNILERGRWSSFETFRKFYLRSRITAATRQLIDGDVTAE